MKIILSLFAFVFFNVYHLHSAKIVIDSIVAQPQIPPQGQDVLTNASPIGEGILIVFKGSGFLQVTDVTFELDIFGINPKTRLKILGIDNDNTLSIFITDQYINQAGKYLVYLDDNHSNTSNKVDYIFFDKPYVSTFESKKNGVIAISGDYFIDVTNVTIDDQPVDFQVSKPTFLSINYNNIKNNQKVAITNSKGTGTAKYPISNLPWGAIYIPNKPVLIRGTHLSSAAAVYLDSISVPFQVVSDNLIKIQSPLLSKIAQKVKIKIEDSQGQSIVEPKPEIYILQPFLSQKLNQYFNKI